MRLWRFREPSDSNFARASRLGTWVKRGDPPRSVRVKPLIIQWEPGATLVGDFTWPGTGDYIVKRSVGEELISVGFGGFELGPVEMIPNCDFQDRKPRTMIQLPYDGPEIADLFVTKYVSLDRQYSSIRVKGYEHGGPVFDLEGIERMEVGEWHRDTGALDEIHVPRTKNMGAFVDAKRLDGCDIFKITELNGWVICTDRVRDFIVSKNYTNITLFEVGEIIG